MTAYTFFYDDGSMTSMVIEADDLDAAWDKWYETVAAKNGAYVSLVIRDLNDDNILFQE